MTGQDEVPRFDLPEWGTEGAPPPPLEDLPPTAVPGPVMTTGPMAVGRVIGLVLGQSSASIDEGLGEATAAASRGALQHLGEQARALGADAVTHVRIVVSNHPDQVAALAYGTAVTLNRSSVPWAGPGVAPR